MEQSDSKGMDMERFVLSEQLRPFDNERLLYVYDGSYNTDHADLF